jgi:hypothetical protein
MNNGFIYLLEPNQKGEYITLNENDGRIIVCKRTGSHLPVPSRLSVADVRYMMFKGTIIDEWFMNHYRKWENKFAKANLDKYNELINKELVSQ